MKNIESNLEIELNKFWDWSDKSSKEYSIDRGYGEKVANCINDWNKTKEELGKISI